MPTTSLPEAIRAYERECRAILSWLSPIAWLHQDDFDRLSAELRRQPAEARAYEPGTVLLPLHGDPNRALLQEMMRHGLVEAQEKSRDGKTAAIYYRLVDHK